MNQRTIETYLHLTVNSITTTNCSAAGITTTIAPVGSTLTVRAISRHVAGISADAANDICSEVLLFGTVVLAMADLTA